MEISFEPMNFINNLVYMGAGMLGIFIVIGLIVATTVCLNMFTAKGKRKNDR